MVDENLKLNKPELRVEIDRDKMRTLGVSVLDVATALQLALSGSALRLFREGREAVPGDRPGGQGIPQGAGRSEEPHRSATSAGELVSLDNLVSYRGADQSSPSSIVTTVTFTTISAGLNPGYTLGDGIVAMRRIAAKVLDPSFSTELSGPARDQEEASGGIAFALVLALVLVYLVLSAQFESYLDPLIVMFTVPLALCGAGPGAVVLQPDPEHLQ